MALATIPYATAASALEAAAMSNQASARLWGAYALFSMSDAGDDGAKVECLRSLTPLLVNPLPAVVEYLGADYPFYFHTLEQAAAKALDLDLIRATNRYLQDCDGRAKLSADYFLQSFRDSAVYQSL